MIRKVDILDSIRIAAPCHEPWNLMTGDEQIRRCAACRLDVYNISEMERDDAIRLIERSQGHLCVRLYRRLDGTVITRDCPKGVRALRRKAATAFVACCALTATIALLATPQRAKSNSPWTNVKLHDRAWRDQLPTLVCTILDRLDPLPPPQPIQVPMQVDMGLP